MRLFRDVARARARARLEGREGAVATLGALSGVLGGAETLPVADRDDGLLFTPEDLAHFDGSDPEAPLYLAIMGRVYDVSAGREYYGVGRSYHHFVGRDATRAFCTGCTADHCLVSSLVGLDPMLKVEARRWLELYEYHDQYRFVGTLVADPVEGALERAQIEEQLLLRPDGQRMDAAALYQAGLRAYKQNRVEEARVYWRGALVSIGEAKKASDAISTSEELRARTLEMLGATALKLKETDDAVEHFEEATDILRKALIPEAYATSQLVGTILADLGAAYYSAGDAVRASARFRDALQRYESLQEGMQQPVLVANTKLNLARALVKSGDDAAAAAELDGVAEFIDATLADDAAAQDKAFRKTLEAIASAARQGRASLPDKL